MKKLLSFLAIFLVPIFLLVPTAQARVISADENAVVAAGEIIDDDLYIAAGNVTVEGTVNGDVYAAGGFVNVKGTINGDVLAAGGMLTISGIVTQDVRAAGGNITLSDGEVGDSVSIFGGNLMIDENSSVGGGLVIGGGSAMINGSVARGIVGGVGSLTVNGSVGKDIQVGAGQLILDSNADIDGKVTYTSEQEASIAEGASVSGKVKQVLPKSVEGVGQMGRDVSNVAERLNFGFKIWSYLAALLVGAVLLYFFRKPTQEISQSILEKPLPALGWGLAVLLLGPLALGLLMATLIGMPLAFILLGIGIVEIYLAKIFVGLLFGKSIFKALDRAKINHYVQLAVGLAVYYLLTSVIVLGFFVSSATAVFGLGAAFIWKKETLLNRS